MQIPTPISRKREAEELSRTEIQKLIAGHTSGKIPDYQMSAFAMAVFFRGITPRSSPARVAGSGCRWFPAGGLGITGGNSDKLESIPGFEIHLGLAAAQLGELGDVMMGQTDRFCPADKKHRTNHRLDHVQETS